MKQNAISLTLMAVLWGVQQWGTAGYAAAFQQLYVSPNGNDHWSGSPPRARARARTNAEMFFQEEPMTDGPLATLEQARDTIRALKESEGLPAGGLTVYLCGGVHSRGKSFELTAQDSGTAEAPIVYRACEGEGVRLMGGKTVTGFKPVSDPAVLKRIEEPYRDKILELDLKASGITDYGTLKPRGFGRGSKAAGLELFFQGKPMTLARWPNTGWARIASVPSGKDGGKFCYEGDRPARWADSDDVWLHGYWTWDWAESYEKVQAIDTAAKEIATAPPHGVYGYKAGGRFYVLNVLEELDAPGEWYVDRKAGMLYFWPPAPLEGAETTVSLLEAPMVTLDDVSHVSIQDLGFERSRDAGLVMSGGHHNLVAGCTFANLGAFAISISGGQHNGVTGCDLYYLGDGGISVTGGNRQTLTPAGNFATNNNIHDFSMTVRTYTPAVQVSGVGNRVANNLIYNAPHMAIGLGGNDHIIELNEIHHVCMETHDAGAFYMGRDWSQRGNVVRYNYMHELGHGDVQAIYLDDWTSGVVVFGNVCHGARRGVLVGGGRDNTIENNIFVQCVHGVHIDQRGIGWAKYYFDGTTTTLFDRLEAVNGTQPPYTDRYPELATLLDDDPALAKHNKVVRNVNFDGGWLELYDGLTESTQYLTIKDNFTEGDPGFVDADKLDFRLKEDSPVFKLGFQRIPMEKIGLYKDEYRTRLPET